MGAKSTAEFVRLYMVPGMQHCGGGPGPSNFNMLEALDQWVDHGVAPDKIIASHLTNGTVDRTRPLCPYPMEAQYTGSGSTDRAENFVCSLPALP
jgi:feruloyl esterase